MIQNIYNILITFHRPYALFLMNLMCQYLCLQPQTELPIISSESSHSEYLEIQGSDTEYKPSGGDYSFPQFPLEEVR